MHIEGLADLIPEGSGGFSQVFRATETRYNRTVAAKVLNFRLEAPPDRARFEQECRAMAQLSDHPHIVPLYSTTYTDQGFPVIIMEFFAGGTLSTKARAGATLAELLDAGVKIASALHTAHERGVTHRDVKPQNVLLSRFNEPALTDFGISAITEQRASQGQSTGITLAYAAPEALDGQSSARTDIYSLAATLYTVLAGHRPFDNPGAKQPTSELVRKILHEQAPPLDQAGFSREVDRVIRKVGMARDPQARPESVRDFGELLRSLQTSEGFEPTPWIEASESPDASMPTDDGDESITVVRTHHLRDLPEPAAAPEPEKSVWTPRRMIALAAGALALGALTFVALWASRGDNEEPIVDDPTVTVPTPDEFYQGPIFAPTDVTISRNSDGTALVEWSNPNESVVEFEIQRLDAAGQTAPLITTEGLSVVLPTVGDTDAPCITMRAIGERGQTSNDIPAPICLGAIVGAAPVVAAVPPSCAPGACDFRLDASGYFPGGTVSILVENADKVDLNSLFGTAYESQAEVSPTGVINWRFSPGNAAPPGKYQVTVVDDQSGLASVTFLELTDDS